MSVLLSARKQIVDFSLTLEVLGTKALPGSCHLQVPPVNQAMYS